MVVITAISSGSHGNCYHIDDGSSSLLLECGVTYKQMQVGTGYRLSSVAGALVTHEHRDHCKAINEVLHRGHDVYATAGTIKALTDDGFLKEPSHHRLNVVKPLKQVRIGTWTVLPFDVRHDALEPVGFLLVSDTGKRVLYATDTYYIRYKFKGITHLLVEVNYDKETIERNRDEGHLHPALYDRVIKSHFSLENYIGFLKANDLSKLEEVHLIHLSRSNANAQKIKEEVQKATGKEVIIH